MAETTEKSSLATRIALILAALTVVVSILNGIPAFVALRGKEAYIAYEIDNSKMLYPTGSDRQAIHKLLSENNVPDAFGNILLSNRGDLPAKEVAITVSVPGVVVAENTEPSPESKPAWVTITKDFDPTKDKSTIKYVLRDVGLNRNLKISVSYISESYGDMNWEVFYDGKPGIRTTSLATVSENARSISFRPTFIILGGGLAVSLLIFLLIRFRSSNIVRALLFSGLRISPLGIGFYSYPQSMHWRNYRNQVLLELAKQNTASLMSISEGNLDSSDPLKFWDGIVILGERKIALDIHTANQRWFSTSEKRLEFSLLISAMAHRTEDLMAVAIINEEDCWSMDQGMEIMSIISSVNQSRVKFLFFSGNATEVAQAVVAMKS